MKKLGVPVALVGTIVLASMAVLFRGETATPPADENLWPTKGWATATLPALGWMSRFSSGWTRAWPRGNIRR